MLVRADSAGASHDFVDAVVGGNAEFSVGFHIHGRVRDALLWCQEEDWAPAVNADGSRRAAAFVHELTHPVDLTAWPAGTGLICRREPPPRGPTVVVRHGHGWRHTCFITNTADADLAALELRHRGHARVEDCIRAWKDCRLGNLP